MTGLKEGADCIWHKFNGKKLKTLPIKKKERLPQISAVLTEVNF